MSEADPVGDPAPTVGSHGRGTTAAGAGTGAGSPAEPAEPSAPGPDPSQFSSASRSAGTSWPPEPAASSRAMFAIGIGVEEPSTAGGLAESWADSVNLGPFPVESIVDFPGSAHVPDAESS